jgi:hypothetical protein
MSEFDHVLGPLLNALERRFAVPFQVVGRPDERERDRQAVDLLVQGGRYRFAVEHTMVESFEGQIADDQRVVEWAKALEQLSGRLPRPGHYVVAIRPHAVAGHHPSQVNRESVVYWIVDHAGRLALGSPRTAPDHIVHALPPEVPFPFTLARWPQPDDGSLRVMRAVDLDRDDARVARIRGVREDKTDKLEAARESRYETVLVLEQHDLASRTCPSSRRRSK